MQVIAHRGWSEIAPENSHEAFAAALTAPCAGIELDLRLTADGAVVACHDATLARFGGNHRPLSRQTLAELHRQLPLPTLEEILERYAAVELLLELKPHGGAEWTARLVRAVCARIAACRERVAILCFSSAVLDEVRRCDRLVRLVRNTETLPADPRWLDRHRGYWAIDAAYRAWTPATVAATRARGLRTAAYTVDTEPALRRCRDLGLDLVISNRPRWAHEWLVAHG